jgi:hypothetical protein
MQTPWRTLYEFWRTIFVGCLVTFGPRSPRTANQRQPRFTIILRTSSEGADVTRQSLDAKLQLHGLAEAISDAIAAGLSESSRRGFVINPTFTE